jgi:transcriptional regulator with XRE-family HTH domain
MEPTERLRAERALDAMGHTADLHSLDWPSVSSRIRGARLASGLDEKEIADRLGSAVDSYCDLESYDDEAFTVPTLAELAILGHVVGVELKELLLGEDVGTAETTITFGDIAQQLAHRIAETGIASEQLGLEIGFSVENVARRSLGLQRRSAVPDLQDP